MVLRKLGKSRTSDVDRKAMMAFMTYIADTEEQALDDAKAALQEHASAFVRMRGQQDTDWAGDISVLLHMCEDDDWRDVFRRRTLICTPEQAAERIQRYLDLGFTEISVAEIRRNHPRTGDDVGATDYG